MSANLFLTDHQNYDDQSNIGKDKNLEKKPTKDLDTNISKTDDKIKSQLDTGSLFKRFQFYDGRSKLW